MVNVKESSGIVLAYLGDAVWELRVREYAIDKGYNIHNLNKFVKTMVNAKAQSKVLKEIFEELSEEEKMIVGRAKNSNIKTFPKSCTIMEYKESTAFEALVAFLYTRGLEEKILEFIKKIEGGKNEIV